MDQPLPGAPTVRGLVPSGPQGGQPRWFICSAGRDIELRTRWLCDGTRNTRNTTSVYWFGPPESKTLHPVLNCIDESVVLGRTPLPALYWLTDKVGRPGVQVDYNKETYLKSATIISRDLRTI
jgi:hypothetical protein